MNKYVLFLFLFPLIVAYGQDSTYIRSYADKFVVKINTETQTDDYILRNRTEGGRDLRLTANNNYRLFVSLDYQIFGFSFGFSPTFFPGNNDDDLKGESSFSNFRFRAVLGKWIQGFQVGTIKGYYVENTEDFLPGWEEGVDPYLQLSNLTSRVYGMSTSYVFNPNFSFRNVFYQTEWQRKSAGSFIPTLYYSYDQLSYSLGDLRAKEDIFPVRLSLSYSYTFVVSEHWFVNANAAPSLGVRFSTATERENDLLRKERKTVVTRSLEGGMQMGYASRKIVFGVGFNFDVSAYNEDEANVLENDKLYGVVYFGYRFNAPGFIDRPYNKYAAKLGID